MRSNPLRNESEHPEDYTKIKMKSIFVRVITIMYHVLKRKQINGTLTKMMNYLILAVQLVEYHLPVTQAMKQYIYLHLAAIQVTPLHR